MTRSTFMKAKQWYRRYLVFAAFIVAGVLGVSVMPVSHAASNDSLYLSPASGSHSVGSNFTVTIYENSYTDPINAVEADLTYPTAQLQYVSSTYDTTNWPVSASKTGGSGSVKIAEGIIGTNTGVKSVGTVTFKVLASGSAAVNFANSSQLQNNGLNYLGTKTGGTYTTASGTTPTPTPKPTATPKPTPKPTGSTTTTPKPTTSTTTIAPTNNPKPVVVPNNTQVELNNPATVQTTGGSTQPILKVEYYLNGKLVATVSQAPFTYSVNTKEMRNGTYKMVTKTFYTDGTSDSKNTSIIVKNPFDATQFKLQAQHYAAYIIVLLVLIAGGVWFLLRRQANNYLAAIPPHPPTPPQPPYNQTPQGPQPPQQQPPASPPQPPSEPHVGVM